MYSTCHDDKKIIIELPKITEEYARTTLSINPIVCMQLEKFLNQNSQVTKKSSVQGIKKIY